MRSIALWLTLVLSTALFAAPEGIAQQNTVATPQSPAFVAGQRVDRVTSQFDPAESVLVYVPSSYNPARPTPVLYLLDARGYARIPADLFTAAPSGSDTS